MSVARAAAAALFAGALALAGCERVPPPGVLAPDDPVQLPLGSPAAPFAFRGCAITPLARFHVTARVLGTMRYHFDPLARVSPVDLALGWGPMSDSAVLREVAVEQMARYYMWHTRTFPIPRSEIETHSANMHVLPATGEVARALARARRGDVVTMDGLLVAVRRPDGWSIRSSLSRRDTGAGACEVVWAESLRVR